MTEQDAFFLQLKEYLLSQKLGPGARVEPEAVLAERFGVSRYKVRRTMDAFAHMGIVQRSPRRGTVVRNFDSRALSQNIKFQFDVAHFDITEFAEARAVMECAALPLAVRRISPSALAALQECVDRMEKHITKPEVADKYDLEFHQRIFQASGNTLLTAFSEVITMLFATPDYRKQFWHPEYFQTVIVVEHRAILAAIKSGDAAEAVRQMQHHLLMDRMP